MSTWMESAQIVSHLQLEETYFIGELPSSRETPGTPKSGTPIPILLPYHSHKNPLKYGNGMEAYGKGVPLLGVPGEIPNITHGYDQM